MEGLLDSIRDTIDDIQQKFYGVAVGTVINSLDPMAMGRVQVQLPFIDDVDLSPWARVATMMTGPAHGTYFIPEIGDEVLVVFEHGDIDGSRSPAGSRYDMAGMYEITDTLLTDLANELL
jgi:hypothetical protein